MELRKTIRGFDPAAGVMDSIVLGLGHAAEEAFELGSGNRTWPTFYVVQASGAGTAPAETAVELIQQFEPAPRGALGRQYLEPGLGVMLRQGDRRQLVHQFVHADPTASCEAAEPRVLGFGNADSQCTHGSSFASSLGVTILTCGK